jgi:hypothetical protein
MAVALPYLGKQDGDAKLRMLRRSTCIRWQAPWP